MNKKTLILGASTNPERYAYLAAHRLVENGHSIVNIGVKAGVVAGVPIELAHEVYSDIDTITLYLGPDNQAPYYTLFNVTQSLFYFTAAELAAFREKPLPPIHSTFFNPVGALPLRFSPSGYVEA